MSKIAGIRYPPDIWPEIRYPVLRIAGYPVGRISGKTAIRSIPILKSFLTLETHPSNTY